MENKEISSIRTVNGAISAGGLVQELLKKVRKSRQEMNETTKKLAEKETLIKKLREEEKARKEAEERALKEAEEKAAETEAARLETDKPVPEEIDNASVPQADAAKSAVNTAETPTSTEPTAVGDASAAAGTDRSDAATKAQEPEKKRPSVVVSADYRPPRQKEYIPTDRARPQRAGAQGARPQYGAGAATGMRPTQRPDSVTGVGFNKGPKAGVKPQEVAFVPKDAPKSGFKKKQDGRVFDDKRAINKKSAMKGQVSIDDFDENKTGYRKLRTKKTKQEKADQRIKIEHAIISKDVIPLKELSEKLGISAVEISKILFKEGIIKTINDSVDYDTAAYVADGLGITLELKMEKTAEEVLTEGFDVSADKDEDLVSRPPVVTVMGHVDHGKTSLLDYIRSSHVTEGEAGGITQHIGAYSVVTHGKSITFIDTPGHAAFTSMRQRGAQVTDIAIIVIAADDGIMPQTVEAINHAKAAGVSIVIAANKIDKPHANLDRVRQQLSERDILVEDWGGDIIMVPVSAKTGEGVDKLLDTILLVAEMQELKANPNRKAKGAVLEAKLDKGKGPVASIIVQNGTLKTGDFVVAGTSAGKVRAMFDDKGRMVKEAGPSVAVSVIGLEEVPNAGDVIFAVEEEKLSKSVAAERKNREREEMIRRNEKVTLDELFSKIDSGALNTINIIIKADVQGSVEAVKQSLTELSTPEVKVNVIHAAVGAINETDVMLADSSNSIIIGFNVRPDAKAKQVAERTKTDIKLYRIIYEAIDDIKNAMKGMLAPKFEDVYLGKAEVRETFKITGVGTVAGCYVTDGKLQRSAKLRIYRDDVMICEGNVQQLKRFKDDVKEVAQGFECGVAIEGFNDIRIGDFIECYLTEEVKA